MSLLHVAFSPAPTAFMFKGISLGSVFTAHFLLGERGTPNHKWNKK
jgi:hypothetical protein